MQFETPVLTAWLCKHSRLVIFPWERRDFMGGLKFMTKPFHVTLHTLYLQKCLLSICGGEFLPLSSVSFIRFKCLRIESRLTLYGSWSPLRQICDLWSGALSLPLVLSWHWKLTFLKVLSAGDSSDVGKRELFENADTSTVTWSAVKLPAHTACSCTADDIPVLLFSGTLLEMGLGRLPRTERLHGVFMPAPGSCCSQRQGTGCVSHISTKPEICKNVQGAHGVSLTKSLIQDPKQKIVIIAWPVCVWVYVCGCMLASALVCTLCMRKSQIGDCSRALDYM